MKHIGRLALFLFLAVNAFFIGMLLLTAYSPYINPEVHPVQSCLGLTFPIFLVINFCFLVFWLIVRYRLALVPLLGFLLCYPQIRTYMPINMEPSGQPENSIKLLSYNIMSFGNMKKENGQNPILNYIKNSKADIVCMQEYAGSETAKIHLNNKEIRQALKDYPYRHIKQVGKTGAGSQIACYSKFPILSARMLDYQSNYNGSMVYDIKIGKDTVLLINNHLESNKLTREDKVVYEDMLKDPKAGKVKSGIRQLVNKLAEASAIRSAQAPQETSEYYTIRQLAEKWGVSIATIWRHEKLGHIKGQRIGRRVLFPKEQIDRIKNLKATNRDADKNTKG